ncbi:MAG: Uma2 family endonuclease [Proteobacteria bacterium]|nr:Uma2 family endonuclease [Pseudomonadota bacterium]
MASAVTKRMSADEFLLWSLDQEARYELVDGIPIEMMTGASDVHDRIVVNVLAFLHSQLRGKRCRPTTADLALRTKRSNVRRPDIMVNCAPLKGDVYEALEPRMAVEVLSKSNTGVAWERKLIEYQGLPLDYILLIDSRCIAAALLTRDDKGAWTPSDYAQMADVIELERIGCRLGLVEIYEETGLREGAAAEPLEPGPI